MLLPTNRGAEVNLDETQQWPIPARGHQASGISDGGTLFRLTVGRLLPGCELTQF